MTPRRFRPVSFLVTLLIVLPVAVLMVWPQAFGAQTAIVVAQLIPFRAVLGAALGLLALAAGITALVRRRWAISAAIAIVLAAAALTNATVLVARGWDDALPDGQLTVLAWNTEGGSAPPASVAGLALEVDADIVSLPETSARAADEVARLLAVEGKRMRADTAYGETGDSWIPTSILIADDLGEYRLDETAGSTPGLPSGVWRSVDGTGPTIIGAHPRPPIPSGMNQWRAGLRWIADRCDAPDVIVAGDLNATVDHLSGLGVRGGLVGQCRDAAVEAGSAAVGTWPTSLPAALAAPIDHVLVGSDWAVRAARVITSHDVGQSDHRPIVAVLDAR